jgi:hypothetical protein
LGAVVLEAAAPSQMVQMEPAAYSHPSTLTAVAAAVPQTSQAVTAVLAAVAATTATDRVHREMLVALAELLCQVKEITVDYLTEEVAVLVVAVAALVLLVQTPLFVLAE